jgi:GNAT superfamily N-acetyltransferase
MSTFRVAVAADRAAVTATSCSSFDRDPVWSWRFDDDVRRPAQYALWWDGFVAGGLRYPWVRVTDGCEAVALWIPPGLAELSPEVEAGLEQQLEDLLGSDSRRAVEMLTRFDAARPEEPHHYLSLFGTHDDHRGKGLGMALLADNLAEIDALHSPSYLESTNPANLQRYARVGFEPLAEFAAGDGGPVVTTMWRPAR